LGVKLAEYGRRELVIASILAALAIAMAAGLAMILSPWAMLAAAVAATAWLAVVGFFRDPDRTAPNGEGLLLSPADGTVTDVTEIGPESDLGRDGVQVGIFMSVLNVHVNRAPCRGRIEAVTHKAGAFLDARDPASSQRNESATITMLYERDGMSHPVVVRQIAGMIARRIVTDLTPGQQVQSGQRIGMIKFGSRLELLAPRELAGEVRVKVGQKVRAGQTVLIAMDMEAGRT